MSRQIVISALAIMLASGLSACTTRELVGGAAVGGAAYEYSNKRAMDQLEEDYREGRINESQYRERKKQIEDRSLVY